MYTNQKIQKIKCIEDLLKLIIVGNKRREIMLRFMLILFPQNNRFLESKFRNCEHLTMTHLIFKSIMATGFHI